MSKKYLGIICLLYSGIFSYVVIFDKLKNFLAPQMQIYIKLSIIPMILIGLVMIFNDKVSYKFKFSDLILLLPLILFMIAGDGRLTTSFASNRTLENKIKVVKKQEKKKEEKIEEKVIDTYDFSNPDYEIIDKNYNELSNYITFAKDVKKLDGKTIRVRGFILTENSSLPDGYFTIGKYLITCCTADAGLIGFVAKYDTDKIDTNKWYEIEGVLEKEKDSDNNNFMYINVINIKEIDSKNEEQYVYPCYSYDDGLCKEVTKYDI